jgi:hypothetical protein
VLEHAERTPVGLDELARLDPARAERDHLAGLDLAQELCADDVEGAALRRDAGVVAEHAERQRPQSGRVAEGHDRVLRHHHGREGALQPGHDVGQRVLDAVRLVRREKRGDDLGVRGAAELDPARAQLGMQLYRVDEVAVVGERHLAAVRAPHGLRVLPCRRAGGGVAHVADGHFALERAQLLLVEDLRDEAQVAHRHDLVRVGGRDPGRLLAAVL